MTWRHWCAGVLCVLGLSVAQAGGTTILPADFRLVVAEATVIVRGRVTDVRAVRSVRGDVESVATIVVDAVLKGDAGSFVSMRVPGGTIGRYRTYMPGAPTVAVGDAAVYLLKRAPGGALWPVGLSSGIYRISVSSGRLMVAPPVVASVTTAAQGPVVRGDLRRRTLPLADFESIVTLVLRGAQRTTPLRVTPGVRGGIR